MSLPSCFSSKKGGEERKKEERKEHTWARGDLGSHSVSKSERLSDFPTSIADLSNTSEMFFYISNCYSSVSYVWSLPHRHLGNIGQIKKKSMNYLHEYPTNIGVARDTLSVATLVVRS